MKLPDFKYHPDPVFTGSINPSPNQCACCGEKRGFIYTGPFYALANLREALCPWCIASGEAATKFAGEFTDGFGIKGVSDAIEEEVCCRTPGFSGWQQERWWTHCEDAGAFLGLAEQLTLSEAELSSLIGEVQPDFGAWSVEEWREYFATLGDGSDTSVYVFRCLHCGMIGGYADSS